MSDNLSETYHAAQHDKVLDAARRLADAAQRIEGDPRNPEFPFNVADVLMVAEYLVHFESRIKPADDAADDAARKLDKMGRKWTP